MTAQNIGLPYAPGNLRHGKPCGARCKRTGEPCQAPAMHNGRCRLHGGKSTGPRTLEGFERMRRANTRHGMRSAMAMAEQRAFRQLFSALTR
jgi:hypothetical protein